jgi:hypothetical protein
MITPPAASDDREGVDHYLSIEHYRRRIVRMRAAVATFALGCGLAALLYYVVGSGPWLSPRR